MYNVNHTAANWIIEYLSLRKQKVVINGKASQGVLAQIQRRKNLTNPSSTSGVTKIRCMLQSNSLSSRQTKALETKQGGMAGAKKVCDARLEYAAFSMWSCVNASRLYYVSSRHQRSIVVCPAWIQCASRPYSEPQTTSRARQHQGQTKKKRKSFLALFIRFFVLTAIMSTWVKVEISSDVWKSPWHKK